ncbi:diguanylate cyclase [bacterium]|nr:diguanylate cyclase [bacterium]NIN92772.1 diguanylate cyclase [bacterium]NIO18753.1 diguanylate cyclase [bacterium]NIO73829.1 diguanylate cyclase [bacterium]
MGRILKSTAFLVLILVGIYLALDVLLVLDNMAKYIILASLILLFVCKDIQSHRQSKDLRIAHRKLKDISEITKAILSTMRLEEILKLVMRDIRKEFDFDQVFLYHLEQTENRKLLKCIASPWAVSIKGISRYNIFVEGRPGILSLAIKENKPYIVEDARVDSRVEPPIINELKLKSFAVIPIVVKNGPPGALIVSQSNLKRKITEDDFAPLLLFANQVGIAIENAKLLKYTEELTRLDELTQVYNQREFQRRLPEDIELTRRYAHFLSLAMLDIDDFKHYNDTNGHLAGDMVLKQLSQILTGNLRRTDAPFRYGGEEFAVILPATSREGALIILEKVRKEVENFPFEYREKQPGGKVTVSIGIATYPIDTKNAQDLVNCADKALYRAKEKGKNRTCLYRELTEKTGLRTENSKN